LLVHRDLFRGRIEHYTITNSLPASFFLFVGFIVQWYHVFAALVILIYHVLICILMLRKEWLLDVEERADGRIWPCEMIVLLGVDVLILLLL